MRIWPNGTKAAVWVGDSAREALRWLARQRMHWERGEPIWIEEAQQPAYRAGKVLAQTRQ